MTLDELYTIIATRKKEMPENSYVASLFKSGTDRLIQKIGEEAVEVIIAAKNDNRERLISETADLLFHTLVMLVDQDLQLSDVLNELASRDTSRQNI